jgi:hypothetical protein
MIIKFSYRVHVRTETLNDREQYYKILEIGMDQFGLKWNFYEFYKFLDVFLY